MNNTISITLNKEFKRLYRQGKYVVADMLVIYYTPNNENYNRLGITVTKKLGKAVRRNRLRRLIKENYRLMEAQLKSGYDMVIVARAKAENASYEDISRSIKYLFRKSQIRM